MEKDGEEKGERGCMLGHQSYPPYVSSVSRDENNFVPFNGELTYLFADSESFVLRNCVIIASLHFDPLSDRKSALLRRITNKNILGI